MQKFKGAEQTKYEIYHAIKDALPDCKNWKQLEEHLKRQVISIEYKCKGETDKVQGISFKKGQYSFKGSEVDQKFSYSKLDSVLNENSYPQEVQQQISIPIDTGNTFSGNTVSRITDVVSAIGRLFDIQPLNEEKNQPPPQRRKIKKKRRRGLGI